MEILSKISKIYKIRSIIYRPDVCNLQTRTPPFPDEEKIDQAKRLSLNLNINTKNPQIEHCLCRKCYHIDLNCTIYRQEKSSQKVNQKVKLTFLHNALLNDLKHQHCPTENGLK